MKATKVKPVQAEQWVAKTDRPVVVRTDPDSPHTPADQPIPANCVILWVGVETLTAVPWNAERRVTRRSLVALMRRISEEGFEAFRPILVSRDGFIGDGHRRWMAAKYLGYQRVPVVFTDKTREDLWAGNNGVKPLGARDWLAAAVMGGVDAPPLTKNQIEQLSIILGDEGMQYLVDRGVSPDIYKTVWKVGQHCNRTTTKFLRQTTYWLIKHKMVNKVKRAIYVADDEQPIDPRILSKAIEEDRPLQSTWGLA